MPITLQSCDGSGSLPNNTDLDASGNNFLYFCCRLAFSGSYPGTPGDNIDLTPILGLLPTGAVPITGYAEGNGLAASQGGNGGYYSFTIGSNFTNNKLRIWTAGGSELASSAYPAAVLTDVVTLNLTLRKLRNF